MKRLLVAVLLLVWAARVDAAIAVGFHTKAVNASGTTLVTTGGTTSAASSVFFVIGCTTGTLAATPITDSKANAYTVIQTWTVTFGGVSCARAQKTNGTGGATHTFTVTSTATAAHEIFVVEITGALTALAIDQSAKGNDAASPFDSPNTGTLGQAAELMVGFGVDNSSSGTCVYTGQNGFTVLDSNTAATGLTGTTETKIVAVTTADHASFLDTGCGATQMDVAIDTFKQAAGGVVCTPTLTLMGVGRCG